MKNRRMVTLLVLSALVFFNSNARATETHEEERLSYPSAGEQMGRAVAADNDYVLVGIPYHNHAAIGTDSGMGVVYKWNGSSFNVDAFLDDTTHQDEYFYCGYSVAVSDPYFFLGCPGAESSKGVVIVFKRSGSTYTYYDTLTAVSRNNADSFGFSVSADGVWTVVGAPYYDGAGSNRGAATVFINDTNNNQYIRWSTITPSDPSDGAQFGRSVAIDYSSSPVRVAIGAPYDDDEGSNAGAVYAYQIPFGYTLDEKIVDPFPNDGAHFGYSVAMDGPWLAVGIPGYTYSSYTSVGRAAMFLRSSNDYTKKYYLLMSADYEANAQFGHSVAISGTSVLVGAPYYNSGGQTDKGYAESFYRYSDTYWPSGNQIVQFYAGHASDLYGYSVAIYDSGDDVIGSAGCPYCDWDVYNCGMADMLESVID